MVRVGKLNSPVVQMAWREKVALNIIIFLLSGMLLFIIIGLSMLLCPSTSDYSAYEIEDLGAAKKPIIQMYGYHYNVEKVMNEHVNGARLLSESAFRSTTFGRDVSAMFAPIDNWDEFCGTLERPPKGWDNIKRDIPESAMTVWVIHSEKKPTGKYKNYFTILKSSRKGYVLRNSDWIKEFLAADRVNRYLLIAYERVFDLSSYMDQTFSPTFLGKNFESVLKSHGQTGKDVTALLDQIKKLEGGQEWSRKMNCMNALFLVGAVDHRGSVKCVISEYVVLSSSIFVVLIIGFKFFAAFQCQSPASPENLGNLVLICVPAFTESYDSIKSTVFSPKLD
jgi:chitin synthase